MPSAWAKTTPCRRSKFVAGRTHGPNRLAEGSGGGSRELATHARLASEYATKLKWPAKQWSGGEDHDDLRRLVQIHLSWSEEARFRVVQLEKDRPKSHRLSWSTK